MKKLDGYSIDAHLLHWIHKNLETGSTILELGSGEGTDLLLKYYDVISVEHDREWYDRLTQDTKIYAPLINGWYDIDALMPIIAKQYDLILVDGPPGVATFARMGFYDNIDLFNIDVPIIIDDTHRGGERVLAYKLSTLTNRLPQLHECKNKSFTII